MTSLNRGLPSRDTCTHGPDSEPPDLSIMRTLRRLAMDRRFAQGGVVGGRARTDVAWRAGQPVGQHPRLQPLVVVRGAICRGVIALDPGHRVELALVPVRARQRRDWARVVEERVG